MIITSWDANSLYFPVNLSMVVISCLLLRGFQSCKNLHGL